MTSEQHKEITKKFDEIVLMVKEGDYSDHERGVIEGTLLELQLVMSFWSED